MVLVGERRANSLAEDVRSRRTPRLSAILSRRVREGPDFRNSEIKLWSLRLRAWVQGQFSRLIRGLSFYLRAQVGKSLKVLSDAHGHTSACKEVG